MYVTLTIDEMMSLKKEQAGVQEGGVEMMEIQCFGYEILKKVKLKIYLKSEKMLRVISLL